MYWQLFNNSILCRLDSTNISHLLESLKDIFLIGVCGFKYIWKKESYETHIAILVKKIAAMAEVWISQAGILAEKVQN